MPSEEGDWLWIRQWGCGCCLIATGIAFVQQWDGTADEWAELADERPTLFRYTTEDGRMWNISWEADVPEFEEGKPVVHWWQKVVLPPYLDDLLEDAAPDETPPDAQGDVPPLD